MDNLTKQTEEVETLSAIYGNEFITEDAEKRVYSIDISDIASSDVIVKLCVRLPPDYPSMSPPTFEICAPCFKKDKKEQLRHALEDVYLSNIGENVIYQWIERIREELPSLCLDLENKFTDHIINESAALPDHNSQENESSKCPDIHHGEIILDRKSSFQAHAAIVTSAQQVRQVISALMENKKIQQATHNMYAYRIYNGNKECYIHDCDDDGESQAGSRLLHLLEIMDVKNVVVVVSRWFGGIHLGADRFKHINNAARQVLTAANLISNKK